jgi:tRNA (cytidine32/uridine32-2'-O)-methyltransferase
MLDNIQIVLSHTSHPGNIGATARAMKTMGLSRLVLINPKHFPSEEAYARSSGAIDVLDNAKIVTSFEEAIADSHIVIGTSARKRCLSQPILTPRQLCHEIRPVVSDNKQISIVFGREHSGMTNEEIGRCQYQIVIPANPEYSSLNLGAAVQLICYEFRLLSLESETIEPNKKSIYELATQQEVHQLLEHWQQTNELTGFLNPKNPGKLMLRIKRLFNRSHLEKNEVNILRGFLTSINKKCS